MRYAWYLVLAALYLAPVVAADPPEEVPGPPEEGGPPGEFPGGGEAGPPAPPALPDEACDHVPDLGGALGNVPDWVDPAECADE